MPPPMLTYHSLPAGSMAATFQMFSSAVLVPDLSPRVTNLAPLSAMALEGLAGGRGVLHAGRVILGPDDDEEVKHEGHTLLVKAFIYVGLFLGFAVHQQQVGIALASFFDGGAGASRGDLHLVTGLLFKIRLQEGQKSGIVDRGGGGQAHQRVGRCGGGGGLSGRRGGLGTANQSGDDRQGSH